MLTWIVQEGSSISSIIITAGNGTEYIIARPPPHCHCSPLGHYSPHKSCQERGDNTFFFSYVQYSRSNNNLIISKSHPRSGTAAFRTLRGGSAMATPYQRLPQEMRKGHFVPSDGLHHCNYSFLLSGSACPINRKRGQWVFESQNQLYSADCVLRYWCIPFCSH